MRISQRIGHAAEDSVDSYLAEVLAGIRPLPSRTFDLDEADGCVLAEDVAARWPLPSFDNSAMDGYAVMARDVAAATQTAPVTLPVDGEAVAGDTCQRNLAAGTCVRITTGALLPAGADAVVRVEWTDGSTDRVAISVSVPPGASVRRIGGDARPGDLLLAAGTRLGPPQLGLLAAAGQYSVLARPRPRVTVISTGNELAGPGEPLMPGRIWESNSYMLAAAVRRSGCLARRHRVVRDDQYDVLAAVREATPGADMLVTSGGVSMGGEQDAVKAALQKRGTITFRKVAMQPGMPQGFGTVGPSGIPIFTLPGNPASAYVSFCLFVAPALDALQGLSPEPHATVRAILTSPLRSAPGRRSFLSGILDARARTITPVTGRTSHQLTALARANALIIVPDHVTALTAGDAVDVLELPS